MVAAAKRQRPSLLPAISATAWLLSIAACLAVAALVVGAWKLGASQAPTNADAARAHAAAESSEYAHARSAAADDAYRAAWRTAFVQGQAVGTQAGTLAGARAGAAG